MKFIVISDTHGLHNDLAALPKGDVLIHGGDFCERGDKGDAIEFLSWFSNLEYKYKILIAGNHDFVAARHPNEFSQLIPPGITYLNDSGTKIEHWNIWGSPVQPDLTGWAFGKPRGAAMNKHWDLIPNDTDILITHTPPKGILDRSSRGYTLGCEELAKRIDEVKPKVHIFGHIHASYGQKQENGILHINGSNIKTGVGIVNEPIVFELN